ncbi:MAG TPA: PAS domain-containing protein [Terriglobia bacterium]|nr:PAS domain-containing protein [Terriglobia bacterium]
MRNVAQPIWQSERWGYAGTAGRNARDLSHASVFVFALAAAAAGILAGVSLSSELGIGETASFIVVAILFPLLCGWLVRERWRAQRLAQRIQRQQSIPTRMRSAAMAGDDTPAGLLIVSPDLRVRFANQTYLQNTLQEPEEVLGWKIHDVMRAEGLEAQAKGLLGCSAPAASCCLNAFIRVGLAGERPVHITLARIAPQQGEDRVLVVVEDLFQGCSQRSDLPAEGYVC